MSIILEAHRGICTDHPENTLAAMRAAVERGYGMIEVDPRFTADNRCVLHHDRTVNRTGRLADGSALTDETPIADLTFEELRAMDFGVWFGEEFRGEPAPTLEEALALAKAARVPLKLDNIMWTHTPGQREIMFSAVERLDALNVVGFTCSRVSEVRELLRRLPSAHVHFDGIPDDENLSALRTLLPRDQLTAWLRFDNKRTAWCRTPPVSPEIVRRVRPIATIGAWLLDQPEELLRAEALGVDIVETDGSLRP